MKDKVTIEGNKDNELELVKKKKLKQLELNFKNTFETTWLEGNTQPVHEGRKKEEIIVKKQTVMKKRNMKITNWLKQKTTEQTSEEDTEHMEWEAVDDEMRIIEEDINEKAREDVERLVESIVTEMVDNTAEEAATERRRKIALKKEEALARRMISEMVREISLSIPTLSCVRKVMDDMLELVVWTGKANTAWSMIKDDNKLQTLIERRIVQSRKECQEAQAKELRRMRLEKSAKLRKDPMDRFEHQMDWLESEEYIELMEWETELDEHKALEDLIRNMSIDQENATITDLDEEIEHEMLDSILKECVKAEREHENIQQHPDMGDEDQSDECILTYSCTGNCTGKCTEYNEHFDYPSASEVGGGKNSDDMGL